MKRTVLYYGIALALLLAFLKYVEFRYVVRDLSIEFYIGIVAVFFSVLGVWAGLRWANRYAPSVPSETVQALNLGDASPLLATTLAKLGISKREHEVLVLIAQGHSNQEIADQLFLSLNTVKSHSSSLFSKLDVKRRTQAIQRAKDLGILGKSTGTFG